MSLWFESLLKETLGKIDDETVKNNFNKFIKDKYHEDINDPPRIAILGATGVGKSSTINALFGTDEPISHTKPKTASPEEIIITFEGDHVHGENGDLIIFDMPGIGESEAKDRKHLESYIKILSKSDVAVWIVSAVDRRFTYDEIIIRDILGRLNDQLLSRLVIGVNKVDLIYPNNWDARINLPSIQQELNINERLEGIYSQIQGVIPNFPEENIIGYSAEKYYRLEQLFGAMLKACPKERAWVLSSRQEIADFWENVDPAYREEYYATVGGFNDVSR